MPIIVGYIFLYYLADLPTLISLIHIYIYIYHYISIYDISTFKIPSSKRLYFAIEAMAHLTSLTVYRSEIHGGSKRRSPQPPCFPAGSSPGKTLDLSNMDQGVSEDFG